MPVVLRARSLWKSYAAGVAGCSARVWVLRGANLEVERGECVAILGARGAGTTTLLHCLAGLRRPDAGCVEHALTPTLHAAASSAGDEDASSSAQRVVLFDGVAPVDGVATHWSLQSHHRARGAVIVATHDLSRVRGSVDRVLLLRDGRLTPLDRAAGVRRVAEVLSTTTAVTGTIVPRTRTDIQPPRMPGRQSP
ncbi:MAG: ATP-binding cassette domain-containing protein [bacterium]